MALYQYFSRVSTTEDKLPDPKGPLSSELPSSAITSANTAVKKLKIDEEPDGLNGKRGSRGSYTKLTAEVKAELGRYAAGNGVAATLRKYLKSYPSLKESSVRTWREKYTQEFNRRKEGLAKHEYAKIVISELPDKKTGRPYLLGEELDKRVQRYLTALRERGAVINTSIVLACAEGLVKNQDSNLLASNGGHIALTRSWGKCLLKRMGFVKRRVSTSAKISVANFEELKKQYLQDIKVNVEFDDIPKEMIVNFDQTGINYVPTGSWTMERQGSKRVEIVAADDKRQITAVFAGSLAGEFLPPQLVYKGTTARCLPSVKFPDDWSVTCSSNHWANEKTVKEYICKIIVPYFVEKRDELKLSSNHRGLVIFDQFKGQITRDVFDLFEANNISLALIPANCTDRLQPMDISVNKAAKDFLRQRFREWYASEICLQIDEGETKAVDLRLNVVKPLGADWMMQLYDYLKLHPEIIKNGFKGAGITDFLNYAD